MAPRKRKQSITIEEEEKHEIPIDFREQIAAKIRENAEELEKTEKPEKKEKPKEDETGLGEKIKLNIEKVKTKEGVIGYILRNTRSASIDLKDPTKVIDYAVLSSSALEASEELSNTFKLGDVKHVLIEGKDVKVLSFSTEGNKVSVFMEKTVDHNRVYKELLG